MKCRYKDCEQYDETWPMNCDDSTFHDQVDMCEGYESWNACKAEAIKLLESYDKTALIQPSCDDIIKRLEEL